MPRTSDKAEKILDYVNQFVQQNGYAPSVREIGAAVGLRSTASVSYQLQQLQQENRQREENIARLNREKLELVSLTPAELCGEMAFGSTAWNPAQDEQAKNHAAFEQTKTYGYVVCASETQITGNGTLFSAVFQVNF